MATKMATQLSKPDHSVAISNNTSSPNFSAIRPVLLFKTCLWAWNRCFDGETSLQENLAWNRLPTKLATSRWQLGNNHTEQIPQGQRFKVPTMAYIAYSMWKLLAQQKSADADVDEGVDEGADMDDGAVEDEPQYNSPTRGGSNRK